MNGHTVLQLATVKEALPTGQVKESWPAPWESGEHRHAVWRKLVVSADPAERQVAADLFIGEAEARILYAVRSLALCEDALALDRALAPLEAYLEKAAARYAQAFGMPPHPEAMAGPTNPHPEEPQAKANTATLDAIMDDAPSAADGPPPLFRTKDLAQVWGGAR